MAEFRCGHEHSVSRSGYVQASITEQGACPSTVTMAGQVIQCVETAPDHVTHLGQDGLAWRVRLTGPDYGVAMGSKLVVERPAVGETCSVFMRPDSGAELRCSLTNPHSVHTDRYHTWVIRRDR